MNEVDKFMYETPLSFLVSFACCYCNVWRCVLILIPVHEQQETHAKLLLQELGRRVGARFVFFCVLISVSTINRVCPILSYLALLLTLNCAGLSTTQPVR
jgi:hypothetical protein